MAALGSRALCRPARPAAVPARRGLVVEAKRRERQPTRRKDGDPGQEAPSQESKRAFGAAPVPPSEQRMSGSLAKLQLTQSVPWQPPAWWDVQVALERARMWWNASPSKAAAVLARLATMQLRYGVDVEPLRRRLLWLLRQQHPVMDDPAAVARSTLQAWWTWAEQGEIVPLLIAWIALALPHMAFLARAAGEPLLTQQQADEIVGHLTAYEQQLAAVAELWARSFTALRPTSELLVYAPAGPLLRSLCEVLIKLPQESQRARSSLREGAAFLARYLLSYAALGQGTPGQGPHPAALLPLPSDASRQAAIQLPMFEGSLPLEDQCRTLSTECVARVALVPLLCYLECQRWLAAHDPAGAGVDVQQFAGALQQFVVDCCLCSSSGTRLTDAEAWLAYQVLAAIPGEEDDDLNGAAAALLQQRARSAYPHLALHSSKEVQQHLSDLFNMSTDALERGDCEEADALMCEAAALLRAPVLCSLFVQAPSWESLGGDRLVQAAVVAGASDLLITLGDACREGMKGFLGPYCDAVGPEAVLQCMEQFAQYDRLADLVQAQATAQQRPWITACGSLWPLLGTAIAASADASPARDGLVQRLLDGTARLSNRSEAAPAALVQVAGQAARTASTAALPVLLHKLLASEWPAAPILAVWDALLGSAPLGEAVAALSQLAAEPGKEQPGGKQSSHSRQQMLNQLAAALLDHGEGEAREALAQALAAHDAGGRTACLLARVQLAGGGAASTAWRLLSACLPAACRAEPHTVAAVVTLMFEQGDHKQVVAAYRLVTRSPEPAGTDLHSQVRRLAALGAARLEQEPFLEMEVPAPWGWGEHRQRGMVACVIAGPLGPDALADVAEELLSCGICPASVVAPAYLEACKACNRSGTAVELYEAMVQEGIWCRPEDHLIGLWAYLAPRQQGSAPNLQAVLHLLEEQGELLAACEPDLPEATCRAVLGSMPGRPTASRPERYAMLAAAAAQPSQLASEQTLLALLDLPAKIVLACLRLAAVAGGSQAAAAMLPRVAAGLRRGSGSQAFAFLELLPGWVVGMQPSVKHWDTALACVLSDGLLGSRQRGQDPVAGTVATVCSRLRAADPFWALEMSESALTAALLAADVLQDSGLALEAVDALEYHGLAPQLEPDQLNAVYTRLLEALYASATSEVQAGPAGADHGTRAINLDQCTRMADAWQCQARAWSAKVTPQTAEAYEALAVVRVLGQRDFSGWKALRGMSSQEVWGQAPSCSILLLLLHGLAAQLQAGLPPDCLPGAVEAAQRLAADLMAEAVDVSGSSDPAAKWPTLDSDLSAAALALVLACYKAAVAEEEEAVLVGGFSAVDSAAAATAVEQAAQGVLRTFCARQEALPPSLCGLLLDAFTVAATLEDWVATTFGEEAADAITLAEDGTPPLLLQQQPAETEVPHVEQELVLSPEQAAAVQWRRERMQDTKWIIEHDDIPAHMLKCGWILQKGKRHIKYILIEEGLPGCPNPTYTHASTPGDARAVKRARSRLRIIYRELEAAHRAAATAAGAGGQPPRKRGGKNKA